MKNQKEDTTQNKIIVFESKRIRCVWHNDEWYFSVIDFSGALTDTIIPAQTGVNLNYHSRKKVVNCI